MNTGVVVGSVNAVGQMETRAHIAPAVPQVRTDITLDLRQQGDDFVANVFDAGTGELLIVTPPVNDQHAAIELAREMWRLSRLILTSDLDAVWGSA